MNVLSWIGRALLMLVISLSIAAWVTLATLQATFLNRGVVLSWLDKSGVYSHILDSLIDVQSGSPQSQESTNNVMTLSAVKAALNKTLTPSYLKEQSTIVVNSVFDWLNGSATEINFSIALDKKVPEFNTNLASEITPALSKLPTCSSLSQGMSDSVTCIPKGKTAASYANELATKTTEGNEFFNKPLTQELFGQSNLKNLGWLPETIKLIPSVLLVLLLTATVAAAGFVLLSRPVFKGIGRLGKNILGNSVVLLVGGLVLLFAGGTVQIGEPSSPQQLLLGQILQQVLPSIGLWLSIFGGAFATLGATMWLLSFWVYKKQSDVHPDTDYKTAGGQDEIMPSVSQTIYKGNKKILLADDDKLITMVYNRGLTKAGFNITIATDGLDAIKKAKEIKPDLMLLDLVMPKLSGFDVLKKLKADPTTKGIPIVILSNLSQEDDENTTRENGAIDYIVKANLSLKELVERINKLLQ